MLNEKIIMTGSNVV